ncbi:hypothetical protein [Blastomonas aquatica]|nr:hypothetical protein [Blastomonas aquatica]
MTGSLAQAQPQFTGGNRPVMLRPADGLDPCSLGEITGAGEGAIMVFPGDTTTLDAVDYLSDGDKVWLCDGDEGGDMVGIVYSPNPDLDCEVGSPVTQELMYTGLCQSGWIRSEWVRVVAG